jgi:TolB-like protein
MPKALLCLWVLGLATPAGAGKGDGPMRVAVMDFTSAAAGAEYESLGKGLQSMVTTDLAQVGALALVERARLKDIEAELKLGKSGAVDKATAVKLGKLAGASHLVTGSFTVLGNKMRIDCRLLGVEDGAVVLADKVEGEKDAFFELEKDLVKKLVPAFGVTLLPKERAAVAKIHTSDFEAFHRFSQGVDLFDAKKYKEAVAALRDAAARDSEFKLATYTLTQYEELIAKLHMKAQEVETAQIDERFLAQQKEAKREAAILERLTAIARRKGDTLERAAAFAALVAMQAGSSTQLWRVEDRFALARGADAAAIQYWALVRSLYPRLPLVLANGSLFAPREYKMHLDQIESLDKFDAAWGLALAQARGYWPPPQHSIHLYREYTWKEIDHFDDAGRRLQLDARATADLGAQLYQLAMKHLPVKDMWQERAVEALAKAYRQVLDLDKSTSYFAMLAAGSKDPKQIERTAKEVESNRDAARLIGQLQPSRYVREALSIDGQNWRVRDLPRWFPSQKLEAKANYELNRLRGWRSYLLVDDEPVWNVGVRLQSGYRVDPLRTDEIRHYPWNKDAREALAILGARPRKDASLRFQVSYAPADDFWPHDHNPRPDATLADRRIQPGRPEVSIFFGLRDVDVDLRDEKTRALVRPTRAFAVRLVGDEVQLAKAVEAERTEGSQDYKRFEYEVVAREKAPISGKATFDVKLDLGDRGVDVEVAGKRVHFDAPKERAGYLALVFRGPGYVAARAIKLK